MKLHSTGLAVLLASLVASATAAEVDQFSGTYHLTDPAEKSYLVVSPAGQGKWNVEMSARNGPLQRHPLSDPSPMTVAPTALLVASFSMLAGDTVCLASTGRYPTALLCRLPVGTPFQVAEAMKPDAISRSATGYVMLVATPAGVLAADLTRAP